MSQPSASSKAEPREFIALMALLMSVVAISIDATLPALGIIGEYLGVDHPNQAQYIISSIFAGLAIGQLISGPLSDAYGRKRVLYIGLSLYLLGTVICLMAKNLEVMLLGRFIQGLGISGPYISTIAIVRDKYSGRGMAKIMSLIMMIFIMVPAIAPAIGQAMLYIGSWHYIFVMYIVYSLGVGAWVHFRLEETLPKKKRVPFQLKNIIDAAKTVFTNRVTMTYTVAMGFVFGILVGDLNTIQQVFLVQFEVGQMFAVYFGLQALAFGASSLVNSLLVERLGMRYICIRSTLALAITSLIFLIINASIEVEFWMFFAYGAVLLFCVGMLFGNFNALAIEPMGHIAGTASAIIGCSSTIIGIVSGTIIGQIYDGELTPIIAGFMVLSFLAFLVIRSERSEFKLHL
jgi:DHA1 family bicyclomycin/chloramphenicol resistance-like MFS transporter